MMSPAEAIGFKKCVMSCFDNREFVQNWERLRDMSIHSKKAMRQFVSDVREVVWNRLSREARLELCQQEGA